MEKKMFNFTEDELLEEGGLKRIGKGKSEFDVTVAINTISQLADFVGDCEDTELLQKAIRRIGMIANSVID